MSMKQEAHTIHGWEDVTYNNYLKTSGNDKYIYLANTLHLLTDCAMPFHTTLNPLMQTIHIPFENYIDSNIDKFSQAIESAPAKSFTNITQACYDLAKLSNSYADKMYRAWSVKDYDELDKNISVLLTELSGYMKGILTIETPEIVISSFLTFPVVTVTAILILIGITSCLLLEKKKR